MMHAKSDSDVTSLTASPPLSPKPAVYYVQSPSSRDSQDGDKSSSMQITPIFNSPMESSAHASSGRHSGDSSASRFSGQFPSSSSRKGNQRKRMNGKGLPECEVILEEGSYDDSDDGGGLPRRQQILVALISFILLFSFFSLILWGVAQSYKAEIVAESLSMDDIYAGEGADRTGVPTKMMTVNCSLKLSVYNPANMFGIHVSSSTISLFYSQITVATGELKRYYQPRKSHRIVSVVLHGDKVPLYGAGAGLYISKTGSTVPLSLDFDIISRGYVIGILVQVEHRRHVNCQLVVDSTKNKPVKLSRGSCTYD